MAKQVSVVGGHGQIARLLSRKLVARGYDVRGLVRSADQFDDLRDDGTEPVLCDLETAMERSSRSNQRTASALNGL